MNDPWWIIRQNSVSGLESLLLAGYKDGHRSWVSYKYIFPANEQYPVDPKLAHWKSKEEAERVAFDLVAGNPRLIGLVVVEECWIKRCKRCYDCLCGEGNRRRE